VAQSEVVPPIEVAQFGAVPPIVAEQSFDGEPLSPVAAVIMGEDIVIRTINIAVLAVFIVAVRSQAVFIVAGRTQEVALLPEAGVRMSPTAVADAVGNK
jgi:hypothetical protein